MTNAKVIYLDSDLYSPNSKPHSLPALHWKGLYVDALKRGGAIGVEDVLRNHGWDPQWRYKMYSQAHYHSTTHELLIVIKTSATILLGGTDERAKPKNLDVSSQTYTTTSLDIGDALLLPAGYAHRMLQGEADFTMIGSYPSAAEKWDMRFPNTMGCQHDIEKITKMVKTSKRKGLLNAESPECVLLDEREKGEVEEHWQIM